MKEAVQNFKAVQKKLEIKLNFQSLFPFEFLEHKINGLLKFFTFKSLIGG